MLHIRDKFFGIQSLAFLVILTVANLAPSHSSSDAPSHGAINQIVSIFIESLNYSPHNESHSELRVVVAVTVGSAFQNLTSRAAPERPDWHVTCDSVKLLLRGPGEEDCYLGDHASSQRMCRSVSSAHCSSFPSFHNGQIISSSCSFNSSISHLRHWSFWIEHPPPLNSQASISLHLDCQWPLGSISVSSMPLMHALSPQPPQPQPPLLSFPPVIIGALENSVSTSFTPSYVSRLYTSVHSHILRSYTHVHPLFPKAFDYLTSFNESTADGTYELQGTDLFAIVSRYVPVSQEEKQWESHAEYGDIQVPLLLKMSCCCCCC
jgi:hypothetical protein